LSNADYSLLWPRAEERQRTMSDRTRQVYDVLAAVYPLSTYFFHSKAHKKALEVSGVEDGMRVLEVATGSGEMFRRLIRANPTGQTIGLDLSPNMAARTQRAARRKFPDATAVCQAVDARLMPFRDEQFDAVVCCYLLELLSANDLNVVLRELHRVLRRNGTFTLVLIGEHTHMFNHAYKVCGRLAPAFWGRQVEQRVPELLDCAGFRIAADHKLRQGFYPSRVISATR
jgi:ubiquinone/menaquinone biosynthesis C-methylase UbiE